MFGPGPALAFPAPAPTLLAPAYSPSWPWWPPEAAICWAIWSMPAAPIPPRFIGTEIEGQQCDTSEPDVRGRHEEGMNPPNIVFEPLARAMFCRASSCRICIAAGEARIYGRVGQRHSGSCLEQKRYVG